MEELTKNFNKFKQLLDAGNQQGWATTGSAGVEVAELVKQLEADSSAESIEKLQLANELPFRLPVDPANGNTTAEPRFSGVVASGSVQTGDTVRISPSGQADRIKALWIGETEVQQVSAGQAVTVMLGDTRRLENGSVIASTDHPAEVANQFNVHMAWMSADELLPGRQYWFKTINRVIGGQVTDIKYRIGGDADDQLASKTLHSNDIGVCNIALDGDIAFDSYDDNPLMGSFWVLDRDSERPVAAGVIDFALRRSSNIHRQSLDVDKKARASQKNQKPAILWLTGLSGSGKSTIANVVEQQLLLRNRHTYVLDGDNVRHGLNHDLGFTDADRVENIRRIGEVSKLMVDAGLVVMTSFISPFRAERDMVRRLVDDGEFIEIFVDTPLEACAQRDPKGLYKKARAGEIKNFTGYDSPYEAPENPDIRLDTVASTPEECARQVMDFLTERGYLSDPAAQ